MGLWGTVKIQTIVAGDITESEHLPSRYEALNSIPSISKKARKQKLKIQTTGEGPGPWRIFVQATWMRKGCRDCLCLGKLGETSEKRRWLSTVLHPTEKTIRCVRAGMFPVVTVQTCATLRGSPVEWALTDL